MHVSRTFTLIAALALALAACTVSTTGSPGDTPPPPKSGEPTIRTGTPPPTIVVGNLPRGDLLSGMLASDAVEGGCPHLETADGKRYQVLYPPGWRIQRSPLQLVAPDGSVYRLAGEVVTVRGAVTNEVATTCQIGPVFQATEVVEG